MVKEFKNKSKIQMKKLSYKWWLVLVA